MVTTDLNTLNQLTRAQLIEKVQQAEADREQWHTRLTEAIAQNMILQGTINRLKKKQA